MTSIGCRLAPVSTALRRASVSGVLALMLASCVAPTTAPWGLDLGDYRAAPRDLIGVSSYSASHSIRLDRGAISRAEHNKLGAFLAEVRTIGQSRCGSSCTAGRTRPKSAQSRQRW
jgi:hypothetical protein